MITIDNGLILANMTIKEFYDMVKNYPMNTPFGKYNDILDFDIREAVKKHFVEFIELLKKEPVLKITKLTYMIIQDLEYQIGVIVFRFERNSFAYNQFHHFNFDYDLINDKDIYFKETIYGYDMPSHHLKGLDLINYREKKIDKIKYILQYIEHEKDNLKFRIQYRTKFIKEFKLTYFILKKAFIKNCNMYEPGIIDEIIDIKAMQEELINYNNKVIESRTKINKFEKFFDKYTHELLNFKFEIPFDEGGDKKHKKVYNQYKHLFI